MPVSAPETLGADTLHAGNPTCSGVTSWLFGSGRHHRRCSLTQIASASSGGGSSETQSASHYAICKSKRALGGSRRRGRGDRALPVQAGVRETCRSSTPPETAHSEATAGFKSLPRQSHDVESYATGVRVPTLNGKTKPRQGECRGFSSWRLSVRGKPPTLLQVSCLHRRRRRGVLRSAGTSNARNVAAEKD
jgi:hypothetical protein